MDPMRSETMEFFGDSAEWIAPHMGTDVAMMLGIAHTLVENGWHDVEFLTRCTTGFDKFAEYLTGQSTRRCRRRTPWFQNASGQCR
ncbi:hypothetical protein [Enterobacter genomosp. O]|uniref:hypothetical protein n=1 Tax=Enterobacter genomosp. O TaxID=2364150 RepID=UPI0039658842